MYLTREGRPVQMEGWTDDLWSGVKKAAGGFLRGGAPGAVSTITGRPVATADVRGAWDALRDAAIRKVAQRPDVQPVLRQEALKSLAPYAAIVGGVLAFMLLSGRRR